MQYHATICRWWLTDPATDIKITGSHTTVNAKAARKLRQIAAKIMGADPTTCLRIKNENWGQSLVLPNGRAVAGFAISLAPRKGGHHAKRS